MKLFFCIPLTNFPNTQRSTTLTSTTGDLSSYPRSPLGGKRALGQPLSTALRVEHTQQHFFFPQPKFINVWSLHSRSFSNIR